MKNSQKRRTSQNERNTTSRKRDGEKLKDLDKDIKHHNNEIEKLTKYLNNTNLQVEKELYIEKLKNQTNL